MKRIGALTVLLLAAGWAAAQNAPRTAPARPPAAHGHNMMMPPHPMPMPAGGVGSLAIQVIQGTKGGPAIGARTVKLELFGPDRQGRVMPVQLDAHGVAIRENLPLPTPLQPRVTVEYAGVTYQAVGEIISAANPQQKITVKVYEATGEPTDWGVRMWHVMVHPAEDGLHVSQMLAVDNQGDRAWFTAGDESGGRSSVSLKVPPAATDVKMGGGFRPDNTTFADDRLTWRQPLPPGLSQLRTEYSLPVKGGKVRIALTAPAPAGVLMVFVPHELTQIQAEGLRPGEVFDVHGRPMRCYQATHVPAGGRVALTISDLPHRPDPAAAEMGSPFIPRVIAALGGAAMLILSMVVLLRTPGRTPASRPDGDVETDSR